MFTHASILNTQQKPTRRVSAQRMEENMAAAHSVGSRNKSPEEIFYLLNAKGYGCVDVDREFGLKIGTTSKTLGYPHIQAEQAIATVLQLSASEIWPTRFDATGKRLKPQPSGHYKSTRRIRHCQKRKAA